MYNLRLYMDTSPLRRTCLVCSGEINACTYHLVMRIDGEEAYAHEGCIVRAIEDRWARRGTDKDVDGTPRF